MPRKPRIDQPGTLHHVTNRGIAKRSVFERVQDVRYFESRLARAVRRGEILLRAFVLLTTHFHLFLESVQGDIGRAIGRIQGEYSRYFNRLRKRDGSLYRGRFHSGVVTSQSHADNLVRYIDGNAVQAGLVADPAWHAASSAYWYARPEAPRWLDRSALRARATELCGVPTCTAEVYVRAFRPRYSESFEQWIMDRLRRGERAPDPLDDLIVAAPPKVLEWMQRKARLADGSDASVGRPLVPWEDLMTAFRDREGRFVPFNGPNGAGGGAVALAGLLRDVAGLTLRQIGEMVGRTPAGVQHRVARHRVLLREPAYGALAAEIAAAALRGLH